jgi:hypothetical protein
VDMPKGGMVCRVHHCRKWQGYPKLPLKGKNGLPRNMLYIQVFVGILSFGIKVDHKLVKDRAPAGAINKVISGKSNTVI